MRTTQLKRTRAGFTLVEMLAVIVILGILAAALVMGLGKAKEAASEKIAQQFLQQLSTAIAEYEDKFGDYPSSQWNEDWGTPPNTTNLGAECLVLALWSNKWGGANLPDDQLVNSDNDESKKPLARFPKATLFELKDPWDNPIAYLHRRDYGRQDVYLLTDLDSGLHESPLKARTNPATNTFWHPQKFQLISAGPDGEFGSEDDIGNWTKPVED